MSTDYGFKCRDCNEMREINNARGYMIPQLRQILANLPAIEALKTCGLTVKLDGYYGDEESVFQFAIEHTKRGHTVVVADEYGREWDRCGQHVKCPSCPTQRACSLKENHTGPCAP